MRTLIRAIVGGLALLGLVVLLLGFTPATKAWLDAWSVPADPRPAQAIVVLGGGAGQDGLYLHSAARLLRAMEVYKDGRAPIAVFTGGAPRGVPQAGSEGEAFLRTWTRLGFPPEAARVDTDATNTFENAVQTRRLLPGARAVVLVTSQTHMRRARAVFEKQGFAVYAAPVPPRPERLENPAARWQAAAALLYEAAAYAEYAVRNRL